MIVTPVPFRLSLIAAALASCLSVHAQEAAPEPAMKAEKVETVEVKGVADPRRDDTATKIVVNHDEIVKYGDTSILDVLKRLPGITVSGAAGRGGGEIRMRGLGSGYTQVLINGERAPAGFSMDTLAPDSIERIEILRAASAEFSTQSVAGTINIVLKKAITKALHEVKAGMGLGHRSTQPFLNLQLSDKAGATSYSLSGSLYNSENKQESTYIEDGRDPEGQPTLYRTAQTSSANSFTGFNLGPRLNWTLDNGDTITSQSFVNAGRWHSENHETSSGTPTPYTHIDSHSGNTFANLRSDLTLVKKLGDGAKLDTRIGAGYNHSHPDAHRVGFGPTGLFGLDSADNSRDAETSFSTTGKYSTPLVEGHSLAFGWDGGANRRSSDATQREFVAATPDPQFPAYQPVNSDTQYAAKVTRLAAFGQDEWNITPRWSLYLGVRWEGINTRTSGSGFDAVTSRSSVFSPLMHTLYKLPDTKGDQLRLAVTRTYKAPSTYSMIPRTSLSLNNSSTAPDYRGNPNLKPELALGLDGSYEHYWADSALFSVSASMRRIEGYTHVMVTQDPGGRWVSRLSNEGYATTRSIEMEAKFPLKAVMADAPDLDLRANMNRNWSTVDSVPGPNNRLDQQTPFSASVGADYKSGQLAMGGNYSFRTGGLVRTSEHETRLVSVRRDLEVYGLWKFDPKNQLRVALNNILKQDYFSDSTYTDINGSMRRSLVYPGQMGLRVTMEMKF